MPQLGRMESANNLFCHTHTHTITDMPQLPSKWPGSVCHKVPASGIHGARVQLGVETTADNL